MTIPLKAQVSLRSPNDSLTELELELRYLTSSAISSACKLNPRGLRNMMTWVD